MSNYTAFFLNSSASVRQLELLAISHPNFSQTYFIVRNKSDGVTVVLEDGSTHQAFIYYPLSIKGLSVNETLDQVIQIQLGDLGTVLPMEIDNIANAGGFSVKPTVVYRTYRSDDLTAPLYGPVILNVTNVVFSEEGCAFEATAPTANASSTGEIYTIERFPMLAGFV